MRLVRALAVEHERLAVAVGGVDAAAELEVELVAADAGHDERGVVHVRAEHERAATPPAAVGHVGVTERVLLVGQAARLRERADVLAHAAFEVRRRRIETTSRTMSRSGVGSTPASLAAMLPAIVRECRSRSHGGGPYHRRMTLEMGPDIEDVVPERPPRKRQRRRRRGRLVDRPRTPVELELTGFAAGGVAMGRAPDGRIAFVEFGIPGERVIAEITSEESSYIEARTVMVQEASPERVEPRCAYYGRCGGCQLQHIAYGEQLRLKAGVVREQMRRIGRFENAEIDGVLREMIGMTDPWAYRNHMRFTVRRDGDIASWSTARTASCASTTARSRYPRPTASPQRAGPHDADQAAHGPSGRAHRRSARAAEAALAAGPPRQRAQRPKAIPRAAARRALPSLLAGVLPGQLAAGGAADRAGRRARTRRNAAARCRRLLRRRHLRRRARAGGAGCRHHRGLQRRRRRRRGEPRAHPNVRRITGTVEEQLPLLDPQPDVVVADPPRAGLDASIIETLIDSDVRRMVYVSCDPATLARDLRRFVDGGFTIAEVQPIDMFPHTQHIECITTLDRVE